MMFGPQKEGPIKVVIKYNEKGRAKDRTPRLMRKDLCFSD